KLGTSTKWILLRRRISWNNNGWRLQRYRAPGGHAMGRMPSRTLTVWLSAIVSCFAASLIGVYLALGSPSLSHFVIFRDLELALGIGVAGTLIVGTCGSIAPSRVSPLVIIFAGVFFSIALVLAWYVAWAAAIRAI